MSSTPQPPPPGSASITVTDHARRALHGLIDPVVNVLIRLGVTPNTITVFGGLVNAIVGVLAATGQLVAAGIVFCLSGIFDGLDGALARRAGVAGQFGAFLDSTIDRYSEAFVLFGLLVYAHDRGLVLEERLVFVTLAGSLLISYTRARAEGLRIECKVGLLTRFERYLLMGALLVTQQVTIGLILFAVLTHVTAIQRVLHVQRAMRQSQPPR